jgi:hypothetical protein
MICPGTPNPSLIRVLCFDFESGVGPEQQRFLHTALGIKASCMDQAVMEIHFTTMGGTLRIVLTVPDALRILPNYALPSTIGTTMQLTSKSSKAMRNTQRTTLLDCESRTFPELAQFAPQAQIVPNPLCP